MKLLISTTLVVALMVQLSLADVNAVKAVQPPNDKLYPIFDVIATRMSEYQKKEISILGAIYTELLQQNKEFFKTHNSQPYQDYKAAIETFLKSVQIYTQHPENCNHQRAAKDNLKAVRTAQPSDTAIGGVILKGMNSKVYKEQYEKLINGFTAEFPVLIKNFITSLDESKQKKNSDLYKFGQEFLKASDEQQQFRAFQDFMAKIKFTENTVSGNEENCKWDVTKFKRFLERFQRYEFVDMNSLNI